MLQQIINILYRYPRSTFKTYKRFGGYFSYRKMINGNKQMAKASFRLPSVISYPDGLPVYFLTGKKYLYQTLFCIQSLAKVSETKFRFVLVDDGSFDDLIIDQIKKQLPGARIVTNDIIEKNLQQHLPISLYPTLHAKRKVYPHIKKLMDVHTIQNDEWKLVLDSDMLFWNTPTDLLNWLKEPNQPIHMKDCVESYGYTQKLMEQLCNSSIPQLLNVGAIGLKSSTINWAKLNKWIEILEQQEGASYYLEQALTAMLIGDQNSIILNANTYIVNPAGLNQPADVLHHYVDLSKKIYFGQAWKKLLN